MFKFNSNVSVCSLSLFPLGYHGRKGEVVSRGTTIHVNAMSQSEGGPSGSKGVEMSRAAAAENDKASSSSGPSCKKPLLERASKMLFGLFCFAALSLQNASIVLLTRWLKINKPELVTPKDDTLIVVGAELLKCVTSLITVFGLVMLGDDRDYSDALRKKTDGEKNRSTSAEATAGAAPAAAPAQIDSIVSPTSSQSTSCSTLTTEAGSTISIRKLRYQRLVQRELFNFKEFAHMGIPACIYLFQNKLIFLSYGKLPSPIFQVTYQSKILTAALMAKILMRKVFTWRKWIALVLLMTGITIVQVDGHAFIQSLSAQDRSAVDFSVGLLAALGAVFCSGLGGVYFEMVLKRGQVNLWVRNVHLSLVSVIVGVGSAVMPRVVTFDEEVVSLLPDFSLFDTSAAPPVLFLSLLTIPANTLAMVRSYIPTEVRVAGFLSETIDVTQDFLTRLQHADPLVWGVILLHCYGGLLVSLLIKYTDNIVKAFAAAIAILIASLASLVLFPDFQLSPGFMVGFSLVAYAVYMYSN
ncbi:unnamed protein product [Amoebophrya sp. A120]|nr:unnamed protein product [Amoebophrya sp. A120]|eukprot:GSA120T00008328001.1